MKILYFFDFTFKLFLQKYFFLSDNGSFLTELVKFVPKLTPPTFLFCKIDFYLHFSVIRKEWGEKWAILVTG